MIHRPPRRVLVALILGLCLVAVWLPGRSAQALQAMPAGSAALDLPSWLWQALASLGARPQIGCSLDPDGQCLSGHYVHPTGAVAKEGCSLDPNGHCLGGQQARQPAAVAKVGCSLDPSGQCMPGRARIGPSAPAQGCSRGPLRCLFPQRTAEPSSRGNRLGR